ncbi:MAG: phosphonate ABC transporter, permease protein PhnE [Chloroflexota bacterium]
MRTLTERAASPSRRALAQPVPFSPPTRPRNPLNALLIAVVVGAVVWSGSGTRFSFTAPFEPPNVKSVARFMSGAFPPELSLDFLATALRLLVETIQISIVGTALAIAVAAPLSVLAMRRSGEEFAPHVAGRAAWTSRWLAYSLARTVLNVLRAVPELVWALLFVVAVGLGPYAGVLAIAAHSTGILGKLYAELFESADPRAVEAGRATGASELGVLLLVRVPLALPVLLSYTLFRWECNMRAATVLGFVGAGGLGTQLMISMKLFQYSEVLTLALVLLGLVVLVDSVGQLVRVRLLEGSAPAAAENATLCRPADG